MRKTKPTGFQYDRNNLSRYKDRYYILYRIHRDIDITCTKRKHINILIQLRTNIIVTNTDNKERYFSENNAGCLSSVVDRYLNEQSLGLDKS